MPHLVAPTAPAALDPAVSLVPLRTVDDLHDADLDLLLADRLADADAALRAAVEVAGLVTAPGALAAHRLAG